MNYDTNICIEKEYEYYFTYNGEIIKADECYSGYVTNCKKNNIFYNNVEYTAKYVKCKKYLETNNDSGFQLLILFIVPFVMFALVSKLFLGLSGLNGE